MVCGEAASREGRDAGCFDAAQLFEITPVFGKQPN
jgi:hypothetical protein